MGITVKIPSAIHGERIWRRVGTRDHVTRDAGRTVVLAVWQSCCVVCGGPF